MEILYFDLAHAIRVHDGHIQNDDYYPALEDKLTHLVFALAKFHCFTDGNKRSAIALGAYFLELNGYDWLV